MQFEIKSERKFNGLAKTKKAKNDRKKWIALVAVGTFLSTFVIDYISDTVLSNANLIVAIVILFLIVAVGIFMDMIGIAVTAVKIEPFNAMASRKIKGAKTAVKIVKNASKVSSVCCDVIGDICGIISGSVAVSITAQLAQFYKLSSSMLLGLLISASVACITVGGKAIFKDIGMKQGVRIVSGLSRSIATVRGFFNKHE